MLGIYESLIRFAVNQFHINGEYYIKFICRSTVMRRAFLAKYNYGGVSKLEELPDDEKMKMKKYVNETFKGETPQFRLDACKIIFTLNQVL